MLYSINLSDKFIKNNCCQMRFLMAYPNIRIIQCTNKKIRSSSVQTRNELTISTRFKSKIFINQKVMFLGHHQVWFMHNP